MGRRVNWSGSGRDMGGADEYAPVVRTSSISLQLYHKKLWYIIDYVLIKASCPINSWCGVLIRELSYS